MVTMKKIASVLIMAVPLFERRMKSLRNSIGIRALQKSRLSIWS